MKNISIIDNLPPPSHETEQTTATNHSRLPWSMLLSGVAFVICTLLMVAPLSRVVGTPVIARLSTSAMLEMWGSWLPADFHLPVDQKDSVLSSNILLFLFLTAIAFMIYGFSIWSLRRQLREDHRRSIISIIALVTFLAGMIFVFTPAMLSHDIYVYAGYGRVIAAHGANPYFTPLLTFPNDPFIPLDDWAKGIAAYGPIWLSLCASFSWIFGSESIMYIIGFRLLGLFAHLSNTLLIYTILLKLGRSPRTVIPGTLLYAWNPLALMESSLGGHNDNLMVTFILWGIFLYVRGEQRGLTRPGSYLPPVIAFTMAALIKYTSGPLIIFFLVVLARNTFNTSVSIGGKERPWQYLLMALSRPLLAASTGGLLALACYIPYWIGHSTWSIIHSFATPPSSIGIEFSIMSALNAWIMKFGYPTNPWCSMFLRVFSNHGVWNDINVFVITLTILVGMVWLWHDPTVRGLALASLLTLGSLLLITPWFFPWYVVWLIALAAIVLPYPNDIPGRALTAFALAFSASAYCVYLFGGYQPLGRWIGWDCLTTIGPPIVALLAALFIGKARHLPAHRPPPVILSHKDRNSR